MHEIITTSLSPHANNIVTHFLNLQESHLYLRSRNLNHDVHFHPTLSADGKSASYYPRAFLWDYGNGFGSLGKYPSVDELPNVPTETKQLSIEPLNLENENVSQLFQARTRVPRNEYQVSLDENVSTVSKLNVSNTKYWSDFTRVLYKPNSLHGLKSWEYNPENPSSTGSLRTNPSTKFTSFEQGQFENESNNHNNNGDTSFIDDDFRRSLESCDQIKGLNFITEVDSGWGGFTGGLISTLKEDYLSDKLDIFTWGLTDDDYFLRNNSKNDSTGLHFMMSRIKTMVQLITNSSMYLPMNSNFPNAPSWMSKDSLWQRSSFQVIPFEFMNSLFVQNGSRKGEMMISMSDFQDGLSCGSKRSIVSDIRVLMGDKQESEMVDLSCVKLFDVNGGVNGGYRFMSNQGSRRDNKTSKPAHIFSRSVIVKEGSDSSIIDSRICGFDKLVESATSSKGLIKYESAVPFNNESLDSFPAEFMEQDSPSACSFDISDKSKDMMKGMYEFVSRYCRSDEREDLKDQLETLKEDYDWGYDDSEYESDDDY